MWTENFQMYKLDVEKAEEPDIKFPTSTGSQKKQGNSRKTSISASLTMLKPFTVWITTNCGKFSEMGIPENPTCSCETCMQVKKQKLKPDKEQWTLWKYRKFYIKAVYHHPAYLTYTRNTPYRMPSWMKLNLESILPRKISITSNMQMIQL